MFRLPRGHFHGVASDLDRNAQNYIAEIHETHTVFAQLCFISLLTAMYAVP
jgi:hypothetical protein